MREILDIFNGQKNFYNLGNASDIEFRINNLKKLKAIIKENEDKIIESLKKDLGKSSFESYATEIGIVYDEINLHIKNIKRWSKRRKLRTSIIHYPAKSYIYKEPYGVVLIIGPFNYPFQLLMAPLVGAISAGNCAILKPSEHTINTSRLIEKIINENFDKEYVRVVNPLGGKEVVSYLLELKFDYIFFTGSVGVGKIVMERASKNLVPVTLELGGKSPCIIDKDVKIDVAAKRLVWGKFLNAGQTCVAPDYVYVHKDIKEKFLKAVVKEIKLQFGEEIKESDDFPRIVNKNSINRIIEYINQGDIYFGGSYDLEDLYIEPTILTNIKQGSRVLEEEIFGPILPVLEFTDIKDVIAYVNSKEKPLALYYFSESNNDIEYVLKNTTSGGVTINDTVIHVASSYLPFGGVGNSGIGSYHGKASFDTFTHEKSVIKRGTFIEIPVRFAPYGDKIKILKKLMK
ncbi:aldehyde dehydrogenase [Clostridium chauvoei]|uniref:Aldehyde dehydrogenase n=2 Tax=Clostridium chauvoei TaxID=46867 RepID=S6FIV6_9CLOT|nr:aldehyde dehydrogenase [Clostridium chauvoei]ATD56025.1 aldehyde dehydrogenase [Clostridium chauvoei]ATD56306.1 aldehyde dehydrogenase [Clostridium chauvoei]MBX7280924.1 aldehyde dehydrogenase [Clostridium chauvoei]MBX7283407.1 aldehyde dehydrogenase [Clostridium chauvoei]MBX7285910.1 aldehyde dehydrogenase [Clostridium chauvoei]